MEKWIGKEGQRGLGKDGWVSCFCSFCCYGFDDRFWSFVTEVRAFLGIDVCICYDKSEKLSVLSIGTTFDRSYSMGLHIFFRKRSKYLRRMGYMALVAVMIGVSNVIMEEDRSPNDTRARIEQKVMQSNEEK